MIVGAFLVLYWALVSEPGFWDFSKFQIVDYRYLSCPFVLLRNMVVRYQAKTMKVSWIDPGQNGGFPGPFLVHWNFSVLEMALKTLRVVQGLSRTPSLFFRDISPPSFPKIWFKKQKTSKNRKSGNLENRSW